MGNESSKIKTLQIVKLTPGSESHKKKLLPFMHTILKYNGNSINENADIARLAFEWEEKELVLDVLDLRTEKEFSVTIPKKSSTPLGLSVKYHEGALKLYSIHISKISQDCPAQQCGLISKDYIIGVEGVSCDSESMLFQYIELKKEEGVSLLVFNDKLNYIRKVEFKVTTEQAFEGAEVVQGILYSVHHDKKEVGMETDPEKIKKDMEEIRKGKKIEEVKSQMKDKDSVKENETLEEDLIKDLKAKEADTRNVDDIAENLSDYKEEIEPRSPFEHKNDDTKNDGLEKSNLEKELEEIKKKINEEEEQEMKGKEMKEHESSEKDSGLGESIRKDKGEDESYMEQSKSNQNTVKEDESQFNQSTLHESKIKEDTIKSTMDQSRDYTYKDKDSTKDTNLYELNSSSLKSKGGQEDLTTEETTSSQRSQGAETSEYEDTLTQEGDTSKHEDTLTQELDTSKHEDTLTQELDTSKHEDTLTQEGDTSKHEDTLTQELDTSKHEDTLTQEGDTSKHEDTLTQEGESEKETTLSSIENSSVPEEGSFKTEQGEAGETIKESQSFGSEDIINEGISASLESKKEYSNTKEDGTTMSFMGDRRSIEGKTRNYSGESEVEYTQMTSKEDGTKGGSTNQLFKEEEEDKTKEDVMSKESDYNLQDSLSFESEDDFTFGSQSDSLYDDQLDSSFDSGEKISQANESQEDTYGEGRTYRSGRVNLFDTTKEEGFNKKEESISKEVEGFDKDTSKDEGLEQKTGQEGTAKEDTTKEIIDKAFTSINGKSTSSEEVDRLIESNKTFEGKGILSFSSGDEALNSEEMDKIFDKVGEAYMNDRDNTKEESTLYSTDGRTYLDDKRYKTFKEETETSSINEQDAFYRLDMDTTDYSQMNEANTTDYSQLKEANTTDYSQMNEANTTNYSQMNEANTTNYSQMKDIDTSLDEAETSSQNTSILTEKTIPKEMLKSFNTSWDKDQSSLVKIPKDERRLHESEKKLHETRSDQSTSSDRPKDKNEKSTDATKKDTELSRTTRDLNGLEDSRIVNSSIYIKSKNSRDTKVSNNMNREEVQTTRAKENGNLANDSKKSNEEERNKERSVESPKSFTQLIKELSIDLANKKQETKEKTRVENDNGDDKHKSTGESKDNVNKDVPDEKLSYEERKNLLESTRPTSRESPSFEADSLMGEAPQSPDYPSFLDSTTSFTSLEPVDFKDYVSHVENEMIVKSASSGVERVESVVVVKNDSEDED